LDLAAHCQQYKIIDNLLDYGLGKKGKLLKIYFAASYFVSMTLTFLLNNQVLGKKKSKKKYIL